MTMRLPFVLVCWCAAWCGSAAAQSQLPEPQQVRTERSYQGSYSESVSRELFQACDGDSDDRLDVFEAASSFDSLRTPRDNQDFAKLDRDRDGFVTWPEFDQLFRDGLQDGGTFRVATARPFVMPEAPPEAPTPLRQFLRTHDTDGDGALSPVEIQELLKRTGLPEALAGPMSGLDIDGNGKVDETELASWFEMLPPAARTSPDGLGPLPPPWFEADRNRDGQLDVSELEPVLRRIDPTLARWSSLLLTKLDRDANQKLSSAELAPPPPSTPPPPPPANTPKPAAPKPAVRAPTR